MGRRCQVPTWLGGCWANAYVTILCGDYFPAFGSIEGPEYILSLSGYNCRWHLESCNVLKVGILQ